MEETIIKYEPHDHKQNRPSLVVEIEGDGDLFSRRNGLRGANEEPQAGLFQ